MQPVFFSIQKATCFLLFHPSLAVQKKTTKTNPMFTSPQQRSWCWIATTIKIAVGVVQKSVGLRFVVAPAKIFALMMRKRPSRPMSCKVRSKARAYWLGKRFLRNIPSDSKRFLPTWTSMEITSTTWDLYVCFVRNTSRKSWNILFSKTW